MTENYTIIKKLAKIQQELKAPKNQRNTFGNYNYRSCEDILEAVKPLLGDMALTISDEMIQLGDRFYIKATCWLHDGELTITNSAYAREAADKKGMDDAQITGAASSYARKYALNGLFAIDDTKDADHDDAEKATVRRVNTVAPTAPAKEAEQRIANATADHFCIIHNKEMKERTSTKGGTWFDHRWQEKGVWQQCNGRPKQEDVVQDEVFTDEPPLPEFGY